MICPYCGTKNNKHANVCKKCGKSLNPISTMKKEQLDSSYNNSNDINSEEINKSSIFNSKNLIIICVTVIVCIGLIMGSVLYIYSNNHGTNDTNNLTNNDKNLTDDSVNQTNIDNKNSQDTSYTHTTETETSSNYNNIKIISGKFYTGNKLSDKTYCDVYVGSENAGTNLKIKILYSRDGKTLNPGNIVPKTVNSDGYVSLRSANAFKYYPDHAFITLYDLEGNILDTLDVTMSTNKGTQTF